MKPLIINLTLLTLTLFATAQKRISNDFTEINKTEFKNCSKATYLIANSQIKKNAGNLTIHVLHKAAKVFKDDKSDENFHEFDYLGDIKGTKLSLVKRTDYNSEAIYVINRLTGTIDTLVGPPIFAHNMRDFACINNPGTDEKQLIQVCELTNGSLKIRGYLNGKADTFLEDISCVNRKSILAKDNKGKYWEIKFKIGN